MSKKVIYEGRETTIGALAKEWNISYHAAWQRVQAIKENRPKRRTSKRPVEWRDKSGELRHFESISELAKFLNVSREWARILVDRQEAGS